MKKQTYYIAAATVVAVFAVVLASVRLLTPEDTWQCKGGQWVRHGNPSSPQPTQPCSDGQLPENIGLGAEYANSKLGLSFQYPQAWSVGEYGPFPDQPSLVRTISLTAPNDGSNPEMNTNVDFLWSIDVWKADVSDAQIADDVLPGYRFVGKQVVTIAASPASELTYEPADSRDDTAYRVYVLRTDMAVYSFRSKYCDRTRQHACMNLLNTVKILVPDKDSPVRSGGNAQEVSWSEAIRLLNAGRVTEVMQTHALTVALTLSDGTSVQTTEPHIDDIFDQVQACGKKCARLTVATE